jgi:hypothetical protein
MQHKKCRFRNRLRFSLLVPVPGALLVRFRYTGRTCSGELAAGRMAFKTLVSKTFCEKSSLLW